MSESLLVAEDLGRDASVRPRIIVDFAARTVRFENCHHSRGFLAVGVEPVRVCRFDEITAVSDLLLDEGSDRSMRAVLKAGPLVHVHASADDLASIFVSTRTGRCRVFADWSGFEDLRDVLREIAPRGARPHWSEDPRMFPVYAVVLVVVVSTIIYFML